MKCPKHKLELVQIGNFAMHSGTVYHKCPSPDCHYHRYLKPKETHETATDAKQADRPPA